MQVDPDGLILVTVACATLGLVVGWLGGVAEGLARARAEYRQAKHTPGAPANCPACKPAPRRYPRQPECYGCPGPGRRGSCEWCEDAHGVRVCHRLDVPCADLTQAQQCQDCPELAHRGSTAGGVKGEGNG
jgi:hypothetical protein